MYEVTNFVMGKGMDHSEQPGRRERKRTQQLDHFATTAWSLFEAEGYEAVTMERIADVADVSKVTLYRHFPVKEALLRHVFHGELRAAWPAIQDELARLAPGRARLARFLELQAAWCESRRTYLLPYVHFRLTDARLPGEGRERSGMDRIFAELIGQGQAAGEFRSDLPLELLVTHFQFAHLGTLLRWLTEDGLVLRDELTRMLDLLIGGMGVPK